MILSDHGMTPALSYRVKYGESLGATVQRILDETPPAAADTPPPRALASYAEDTEYADIGPEVVEAVAQLTPAFVRRAQGNPQVPRLAEKPVRTA